MAITKPPRARISLSRNQLRRYKLSDEDGLSLIDKSDGFCGICEGYLREDDIATIDHIRPQASGGSHWIGNLHLVHQGCNSSKRDRPLSNYRETYDGRNVRSF